MSVLNVNTLILSYAEKHYVISFGFLSKNQSIVSTVQFFALNNKFLNFGCEKIYKNNIRYKKFFFMTPYILFLYVFYLARSYQEVRERGWESVFVSVSLFRKAYELRRN